MKRQHTQAKEPGKKLLLELVSYAAMAPSVHNTQPWRFRVRSGSIEVYVHEESLLEFGDPTLRQLWISMGACLENLVLAAEAKSLVATIKTSFKDDFSSPIAIVSFKAAANKPRIDWLRAIKLRHTNRAPYYGTLKPGVLTAIASTTTEHGIQVIVSEDQALKNQVAQLISKAMGIALGHPDFRSELKQLVHHNWRKTSTGMPGYVFGKGNLGSVIEKAAVASGLGGKRKAASEGKLYAKAPAIILILSQGDVPKYWLSAGRVYERILLLAAHYDLDTATSAATVEAADFHEDIEKAAASNYRLQAVIRLGKSHKRPQRKSPRLPIKDLLT